ncbi:tetraspanin-19-like isoform X2 [Brienomyrus brachyistius]|uniref:tetraspanin-19-like isoform X2 n=1 Tax=Brienomyrus brachyistius TaxID=42636 RepID=UPI0020B41604|nr:tetraspanin-19-like isoform X2 [Brienomyrus brachyistius]
MKRKEKVECLKFFVVVFNSMFLILGLAFFSCGVWVLFDQNSLIVMISAGNAVKAIAAALFTMGLLVAGISVLGYIGAATEIRCFIILISGALMDEIDQLIIVYGNKTAGELAQVMWQLLDTLQCYGKCCGRMNYTDWDRNLYISSLPESNIYPWSCFNVSSCPVLHSNNSTQGFGQGSAVYLQGCQQSIEDWLLANGLAVLELQLGLVLIQALQLALGLCFCHITQRKGQEVQPELNIPCGDKAVYLSVACRDLPL